jgi:hypothetical protein
MSVEWLKVGRVTYAFAEGLWYQAHDPVTGEVALLLNEIRQLRQAHDTTIHREAKP